MPLIPPSAQASTLSPILWDDAERKELLAGSPVLEESRTRAAQLKAQWQALNDGWFSKQPDSFPAGEFVCRTKKCRWLFISSS